MGAPSWIATSQYSGLVQLSADGGKPKYGNAGAKYGMGRCDAQCLHDLKPINDEISIVGWEPSATDPNTRIDKCERCCTEIDLGEPNQHSFAFTMRGWRLGMESCWRDHRETALESFVSACSPLPCTALHRAPMYR